MSHSKHKVSKKKSVILPLLSIILFAGCEAVSIKNHYGNTPKTNLVDELRPGTHRKEDVVALLGAPSVQATFDDKTWYYIGKTDSRIAFFTPDIVESQVLIMTFDEDDTLTSIDKLDKSANRDIAMIGRETPTAGEGIGLIEQLLGNIGRFNRKIER